MRVPARLIHHAGALILPGAAVEFRPFLELSPAAAFSG
jgi:hypothetical protein